MKHKFINALKYFVYRLRIGVYVLSNKRIDFPSLCRKDMFIKHDDLSYFTLSANTITIINTRDGEAFFREVLPHKRKKEYFELQIERFLKICVQGMAKVNFSQSFPVQTCFSSKYVEHFKEYLKEKAKKSTFIRKMAKCDYVLRRERFSIWNSGGRGINNQALVDIGLSDLYEDFPEIAPLFLSYMGGSAYCYRVNRFNKLETFYAQKSMASYEVAKQLGKATLLTEALPTKLLTEDGAIFGVLSPRAKGKRAQDSDSFPTPSNQRDLSSLWILDMLCCQPDHGPNNYNVIPNDENICRASICAFDNDNMFTFFPVFNVKRYKANNCANLIASNGLLNLPHMDKTLCETILNTTASEISAKLKPYLNGLQIMAFRSRYNGLQKSLRNTIDSKEKFLLDDNEWNEQTLNEEISRKKECRTYLTLLNEYVVDHLYE